MFLRRYLSRLEHQQHRCHLRLPRRNGQSALSSHLHNAQRSSHIYTLSLHDALPILFKLAPSVCRMTFPILASLLVRLEAKMRSEERFSRNAETDLVCRLLLEKKKKDIKHFRERKPSIRRRAVVPWAMFLRAWRLANG